MARIVLVRHGQTEWNRVERFRGRIDLPLNETGLWQAERTAEAIRKRFQVGAVYSSPLSRATRTAEPIGRRLGKEVRILPALTDFSYGEWEGKTPEEVETAYPEECRIWLSRPHQAKIPGGESLQTLRRRVALAVSSVAREHQDDTVVLVTHKMVAKMMACYLLGLGNSHLWRLELDNASISIFERREGIWVTLLLNETCQLERVMSDES